jgi:peptidoglycan/LPS O-acetylase OafA/YrhL
MEDVSKTPPIAIPLRARIDEVFRRKPGRYEALDGLRAIAIIWVVFFHAFYVWGYYTTPEQYEAAVHAPWNWIWTKGFLSINLFFVLSGFLIGDLLWEERDRRGTIDFRRFYIRRFFRLAPAYYLLLAGFVVYWCFEPGRYSLRYFGANLLYLNNWFPHREQPALWLWSLAIEEQFYLVCPLLVYGLAKRSVPAGTVLLILIGLSIAWGYDAATFHGPFPTIYHPTHQPEAYFRYFDAIYANTFVRASALLMGVGCAWLRRDPKWRERLSSAFGAGLLGFFFLVIGFLSLNPDYNPKGGSLGSPIVTALFNPLSSFSFACLLLLALTRRGLGFWVERFLASPAWYPIAQLSYGIYLLHCVVLTVFYRILPPDSVITPGSLVLRSCALFAASFLVAVPLFLFVEAPLRRVGYRLGTRKEARDGSLTT